MIRAACHCGAARITLDDAPGWVCDCNCSICRRYGTLWAYSWDSMAERTIGMTLVQGSEAVEAYIWGDRELGFWRCKACGCVTHHTVLNEPDKIRGVNARMFVNFDPQSVTIRRSDNAHTGWFWTRPDAPIWKGAQPPPDGPAMDDWR